MVRDYKDLNVWQMSMELCEKVYGLVRGFPTEERFALADQLRRAAVSIPSNIAEGNGRNSRTEYARFLSIARGSVSEVRTQLELAERFGYIKVPEEVYETTHSISKMLFAMIQKLSVPSSPPSPPRSHAPIPDSQSPIPSSQFPIPNSP